MNERGTAEEYHRKLLVARRESAAAVSDYVSAHLLRCDHALNNADPRYADGRPLDLNDRNTPFDDGETRPPHSHAYVDAGLYFTELVFGEFAACFAMWNDPAADALIEQAAVSSEPRQFLRSAVQFAVAALQNRRAEANNVRNERRAEVRSEELSNAFPGPAKGIRLLEIEGLISSNATGDEILQQFKDRWPNYEAEPKTVKQALRRRAQRRAR
jgi:hypothetical protein